MDGLDALVKDISLQNSDNGSVSASSGHFSRTIAKPTNAYGPTAVRGNSSDSSLLQVDRPKVLLGNTGANKVKVRNPGTCPFPSKRKSHNRNLLLPVSRQELAVPRN